MRARERAMGIMLRQACKAKHLYKSVFTLRLYKVNISFVCNESQLLWRKRRGKVMDEHFVEPYEDAGLMRQKMQNCMLKRKKERNGQNVEILNYGLQYKAAPSYFVSENAKELHKEQCVVEPVLFYPWGQASNPSYCFTLFWCYLHLSFSSSDAFRHNYSSPPILKAHFFLQRKDFIEEILF